MPAKKITQDEGNEEEEITVDMTTAKTLQPLDPKRPYLVSVSAWDPTLKSASGGRMVKYVLTVVEPKDAENRTVTENVSLENEFTLGRVKTLLLGLGFPEDKVNVKKFVMPKEDDVMGLQATIWVRTQKNETFGDRSVVTRVRPAATYQEVIG